MDQRNRISILGLGVIMGVILGLIFKDMYKCLITGIVTASAITIMLSQQAKKITKG
ncbi:hypothetical protein [Bacillus sp. NPDC094077]|uniref:hypothetical protein n=1 Tax=Bacillus sp. NPDC094077 TaxID=3390932 RepID=UPI003CFD8623